MSDKPQDFHIHENFVSPQEVETLLGIFESAQSDFEAESTGHLLGFGQDNFHASPMFKNPKSISKILPEHLEFLKEYYSRVEERARLDSGLDVFLSVLWFVKISKGGFPAHGDNEPNAIYQYDQTCILYLNDCEGGGQIVFPEFGYTFTPKAGTLISFPSNYIHEVLPVVEPRYSLPSWLTQDAAYSLSHYL
jgi:hypothetical protein